jgi:hypothetical protein
VLSTRVARWAAWAPGLEGEEDWRRWAAEPYPLAAEGRAEARFLPAMLRRRCTPLTRAMLTAAYACSDDEPRETLRTVFASRHGSINESIGLLEAIVRGEKISPAKFSHTVHNAQAGLFSIAAGNRCASSSLSGMEDTFACAWIEALTHLERDPEGAVLLVMGDVPLAEAFAPLCPETPVSYALALLLRNDGAGPEIGIEPAQGDGSAEREWPDALSFLRWLLGDAPSLTLASRARGFCWKRGSSA